MQLSGSLRRKIINNYPEKSRGISPEYQGMFRKIEQDNCFIIQQILIVYHFHNKKNFSCMIKTPKASNK